MFTTNNVTFVKKEEENWTEELAISEKMSTCYLHNCVSNEQGLDENQQRLLESNCNQFIYAYRLKKCNQKNQGSSQTDNNEVSQSTVVISSINNALKDWISEVAV